MNKHEKLQEFPPPPPPQTIPSDSPEQPFVYTCNEYREEMILLALQQRLQQPDLTEAEKLKLSTEIAELTERIGL